MKYIKIFLSVLLIAVIALPSVEAQNIPITQHNKKIRLTAPRFKAIGNSQVFTCQNGGLLFIDDMGNRSCVDTTGGFGGMGVADGVINGFEWNVSNDSLCALTSTGGRFCELALHPDSTLTPCAEGQIRIGKNCRDTAGLFAVMGTVDGVTTAFTKTDLGDSIELEIILSIGSIPPIRIAKNDPIANTDVDSLQEIIYTGATLNVINVNGDTLKADFPFNALLDAEGVLKAPDTLTFLATQNALADTAKAIRLLINYNDTSALNELSNIDEVAVLPVTGSKKGDMVKLPNGQVQAWNGNAWVEIVPVIMMTPEALDSLVSIGRNGLNHVFNFEDGSSKEARDTGITYFTSSHPFFKFTPNSIGTLGTGMNINFQGGSVAGQVVKFFGTDGLGNDTWAVSLLASNEVSYTNGNLPTLTNIKAAIDSLFDKPDLVSVDTLNKVEFTNRKLVLNDGGTDKEILILSEKPSNNLGIAADGGIIYEGNDLCVISSAVSGTEGSLILNADSGGGVCSGKEEILFELFSTNSISGQDTNFVTIDTTGMMFPIRARLKYGTGGVTGTPVLKVANTNGGFYDTNIIGLPEDFITLSDPGDWAILEVFESGMLVFGNGNEADSTYYSEGDSAILAEVKLGDWQVGNDEEGEFGITRNGQTELGINSSNLILNGKQISGVNDALNDDEAVNLSQLNNAIQNIDPNIGRDSFYRVGDTLYHVNNQGDIQKEYSPIGGGIADGDAWGVTGENTTTAVSRTGSVSIGTNSFSEKLNIFGSGVTRTLTESNDAAEFRIRSNSNSIISDYALGTGSPIGTSREHFYIYDHDTGRVRLELSQTGQFKFNNYTGTNFDDSSPSFILGLTTSGDIVKTNSNQLLDGDAWGVTGEDISSVVFRDGSVAIGTSSIPSQTKLNVRETGSQVGTWKGRIVSGGENAVFLMGEYNDQAWLGAHTGLVNAWEDLYINPDGGKKVHLGRYGTAGNSAIMTLDNSNSQVSLPSYTGTNFDNASPAFAVTLDASGNVTKSPYIGSDTNEIVMQSNSYDLRKSESYERLITGDSVRINCHYIDSLGIEISQICDTIIIPLFECTALPSMVGEFLVGQNDIQNGTFEPVMHRVRLSGQTVTLKDTIKTRYLNDNIESDAASNFNTAPSKGRTNEKIPVGQDGWIEYIVTAETANIQFGLSSSPGSSLTNKNIQYGVYQFGGANNSQLLVVSNGFQSGNVGNYVLGDTLRVERTGNVVEAKKNGVTFHTFATIQEEVALTDITAEERINVICELEEKVAANEESINNITLSTVEGVSFVGNIDLSRFAGTYYNLYNQVGTINISTLVGAITGGNAYLRVVSDGVNPINFASEYNEVNGMNNGDILASGTYSFYFLKTPFGVSVNVNQIN